MGYQSSSQGSYSHARYNEALYWCKKAIDAGDVESLVILGMIYLDGKGVAKDINFSHQCREVAARRGNERTQRLLVHFKLGQNGHYYLS